MIIVYKSNTGFTKEYAEMLAKSEKMKACALDEAVDKLLGFVFSVKRRQRLISRSVTMPMRTAAIKNKSS